MSSFGTLASVPLARPEHVVPRTRNLEAAALHACAIDRVVQYMSANAAEPMRLKVLADIAHCSPWHLDRIFSNATGLSPMRYISLLRINAAKLEIMRSDHRIIEIAYDAGYNSLGSFGKRFTELVGLSPREVRKPAGGRRQRPCRTDSGGRPRNAVRSRELGQAARAQSAVYRRADRR